MSSRTRKFPGVPSPATREKAPKNSSTPRTSRNRLPYYLKPGSAVEISSDEPGFRGSWYPGKVVTAPSSDKDPVVQCQVEYTTLFIDRGGKKRLKEIVTMCQLRPPAPPMSEREKMREIAVGDEVDAYYNDGWWEGTITEVLCDGNFSVYFKSSKEQIPFGKHEMRFHREWIDGAWKPPLEDVKKEEELEEQVKLEDTEEDEEDVLARIDPETAKAIAKELFSSGTLVEVSSEEEGFKGSWFVAKVIEAIGEDKYIVEYRDLREENGIEPLREEADFLHIRPPPPPNEDDVDYVVGDKIDAFYNDGWWVGVVTESLKDGIVGVYFWQSGERMRFGRQGLRLHKDWVNGTWQRPLKPGELKRTKIFPSNRNVRPKQEIVRPKQEIVRPKKEIKTQEFSIGTPVEIFPSNLNVRPKKEIETPEFSIGTPIEVSSEDEGFEDSWFPAKLINYIGKDKCLVEYENLKAEDGKEPLREEIHVSLIRPQPPERVMVCAFEKRDKVNALYNDGWWVGEITKVLAKANYLVCFNKTQEVLKFHHSQLRLHQEWIDGKWITPSKLE